MTRIFAEDRDKIKKRDFPLMVVAKVGNETKKVIVQEGENKEKKLAEASNTVQKEFESLSSKNYDCFTSSKPYQVSCYNLKAEIFIWCCLTSIK